MDYIWYIVGLVAIVLAAFAVATGRWRPFGQVKAGVYKADESVAVRTKFVSPIYGEDLIEEIKTIHDAQKKKLQIKLQNNPMPLIDDFILDETVFIVDPLPFIANDATRKIILHIPKEGYLRDHLGVKRTPDNVTRLALENKQYKEQLDRLTKDKLAEVRGYLELIREARQSGGQGVPPWMAPGGLGSRYRYGGGGGEEE